MPSLSKEEPKPHLEKDRVKTATYPELVVCSICKGILWLPKGCKDCETPYCSSCIKNRQLETSKPIQCPTNCSGFIEDRCSRAILFILSKLEVECLYTPHGCNETLPYNNLETHEEACGYQQKTCSGCGQAINKKDFQKHESTCSLVSLKCPECDTIYQRQDAEKHTDIKCLRIQLRQQKEKINQLEKQVNSLMGKNQPDKNQ
jgi:uncharacterized C2H2 Zn-finger protein